MFCFFILKEIACFHAKRNRMLSRQKKSHAFTPKEIACIHAKRNRMLLRQKKSHAFTPKEIACFHAKRHENKIFNAKHCNSELVVYQIKTEQGK